MPGMMGGGGGGTTVQKTTSEPPEFLVPYLQRGVGKLEDIYNRGTPAYFPGETVAGMTPQQSDAIGMISARARGGSPITGAAQGYVGDVLKGDYLDPSRNPAFQSGLAAAFRPIMRNVDENLLPGMDARFSASGRYGSGGHQIADTGIIRDANTAMSDAAAKATMGQYGAERGMQQQAAGMAPQLANQDYYDATQLGAAGEQLQALNQQKIDAERERYNYGQTGDFDYLSKFLQTLNGVYPGGTTTGTTTRPQADGFSQFLGSAASLASLGAQFGMFSDARLKENIAPVGKLNDGQTVYSYTYKGNPTPQIGLMAQEVAQVHPEAVHVDPASGYLKVNYAAATSGARGLM